MSFDLSTLEADAAKIGRRSNMRSKSISPQAAEAFETANLSGEIATIDDVMRVIGVFVPAVAIAANDLAAAVAGFDLLLQFANSKSRAIDARYSKQTIEERFEKPFEASERQGAAHEAHTLHNYPERTNDETPLLAGAMALAFSLGGCAEFDKAINNAVASIDAPKTQQALARSSPAPQPLPAPSPTSARSRARSRPASAPDSRSSARTAKSMSHRRRSALRLAAQLGPAAVDSMIAAVLSICLQADPAQCADAAIPHRDGGLSSSPLPGRSPVEANGAPSSSG